jgi:hypothetical protein
MHRPAKSSASSVPLSKPFDQAMLARVPFGSDVTLAILAVRAFA